MKKILFSLLIAFSISLDAFAQPSEGDVEVGLGFGYNTSSLFYSEGLGGVTDGFNFAGSVDYYFSNRWSMKVKVIYDQKGWNGIYDYYDDEWDYSEDNYSETLKYDRPYSLNYITVPIMANLHFAKKRNWYVNFGPYMGFLLNAENDLNGNSIEQDLNTTDFGFAFDIGVKIPLNNNLKLYFEYGRQNGLKNIFNNFSNYDNDYIYYQDDWGINLRGSLNFGLIYQISKSQPTQK